MWLVGGLIDRERITLFGDASYDLGIWGDFQARFRTVDYLRSMVAIRRRPVIRSADIQSYAYLTMYRSLFCAESICVLYVSLMSVFDAGSIRRAVDV